MRKKYSSLLPVLLSSVVVIVLSTFISKVNLSSENAKASAEISFPADHNKHPNFKTEWWYLNMLTRTTTSGKTNPKDLAYVLSFQRLMPLGIESSFLLTSRYDNEFKKFNEKNDSGNLKVELIDGQRLSVTFTKDGKIQASLTEQPIGSDRKRVYALKGENDRMGKFDLTLKERSVGDSGYNTPLLWGGTNGNCRGTISVFSQNDTFYYSIPDLDISGTIVDIDGVQRTVSAGKAWIDHQWFNSIPNSNWLGHYWTNFHFTTSDDLYSSEPHRALGIVTQIYKSGQKYTYWVRRGAKGTNYCGQNVSFNINSYYGNNFPSAWTVDIGDGANILHGYSFSADQVFTDLTGKKFVEAASYYKGTFGGNPVNGLGFFETSIEKK